MISLEVGNLDGLLVLILLVLLGLPSLLIIVGFVVKKNRPEVAKALFILAAVYLLVGLGICGSLMLWFLEMIFLLIAFFILILPPIILVNEGLSHRKTKPDKAKIWYIIAVVYLIIGFGVCGSIIG